MEKIYDWNTKKLREVVLTRGEQLILLKENNQRVKEQKDAALKAGGATERPVAEVSPAYSGETETLSLLCGEWVDEN